MEERFETFTVLIARINRGIKRIKAEEMAEFGLKGPHVSCLYYLSCCGEMTAAELCERCDEDKATISRALEYLEDSGYLRCESKTAKRYKSPLVLTEKGLATGKLIADKIDCVLEEVSVGLTEEERLSFYRSLTIISESLDAVAKSSGKQSAE